MNIIIIIIIIIINDEKVRVTLWRRSLQGHFTLSIDMNMDCGCEISYPRGNLCCGIYYRPIAVRLTVTVKRLKKKR